ncbi:unnamed protein product [Cochlearia groenlandica]
MLSLLSIVLTIIALTFIPFLFFSFFKTAPSQHNNKEESNKKRYVVGIGEEETLGKVPNHVAIILDGNRRWAKKHGLTVSEGHEAGGKRVIELSMDFFALGINTVSLFAFSTENWGRPKDEIDFLMKLFERRLFSDIPFFRRNKIKVSVMGNRRKIPESLLNSIQKTEEATQSFKDKNIILAIDYSGKYDILHACKNLAEKAKNGQIKVDDIDEKLMEEELLTNCCEFPNPDLLIRTSGEQRISNFFLWQSAYTELYFPSVLWPDFDKNMYLEAINWYQKRQRRFGGTV